MRLLYNNIWDDYDILSISGEDGNFPKENTQNVHTDEPWRTLDDADEYIVMDFGTAQACTCVAISGHNLTNAATVKFQMHTADAWGAPDLDQTLTWRADHIIGFFSSTSKRYCRISIDDPANTDGYIEVGRIFIGTHLQVSPSSLIEYTITNERSDIVTETDMGSVFATPGRSLRRFQYSFPSSPQTMIASMRTVYDEVGNYKPFYLLNYDTTWTNIAPAYVRMVTPLTENRKAYSRATYDLEMKEVV